MAEKKKTLKQTQEITRHLLPDWSNSNHSRKMSPSLSPILRLALRLDEQYLARELLYPLSSTILSPKTVPAMVRLQKAYGSPWLIDVMRRRLAPSAYEGRGNPIDKLAKIIKRWVTHTPAKEDKVTGALDCPPRTAGDWSITETVSCGCADCKVLTAFLQSSGEERKVWPLAKGRRMLIHQAIEAMGVPVTHKTERRGSPPQTPPDKNETAIPARSGTPGSLGGNKR